MEDPWGLDLELPAEDGKGKEKEALALKDKRDDEKDFQVDEDLDELDRLVFFIKSANQTIQQRVGIELLPQVLPLHAQECSKRVFPLLRELLLGRGKAEHGLQVRAGEILGEVFEAGHIQRMSAKSDLVELAREMLASESDEVRDAWCEAVVPMLDYVMYEVLKDDLLLFALAAGEVAKPFGQRLVCARLVGPLSSRLALSDILDVPPQFASKPKKEKAGLLDRAVSLCQDTDHRIRSCLAEELATVAKSISEKDREGGGTERGEESVALVADEMVELLNDEELSVRDAALGGAVRLIEYLPPARRKLVAKMIAEMCGKAEGKGAGDVEMLSKHLGPVLHEMIRDMDSDALGTSITFLSRIPHAGGEEARRWCAYNLPGLCKACGMQRCDKVIVPLVEALARDESAEVRRQLVLSLTGLIDQMGMDRSQERLRGTLLRAAEDDDAAVRGAVVHALPAALPVLVGSVLSAEEVLRGVACIGALLQRVQGDHTPWREELAIMEALRAHAKVLPSHAISETFVPSLLRTMGASNPQVARAAAHAACTLLRACRNGTFRLESCKRFVMEWGRSQSFARRLLFVDICWAMIANFSRNFFKCFFIDCAIEVLRDPVVNVRRKAAALLPEIKKSLRAQSDNVLFEGVSQAEQRLLKDVDRDVQVAAEVASKVQESGVKSDSEDAELQKDEGTVHGTLDRRVITITQNGHAIDMSDFVVKKAGPVGTMGKLAAASKSGSNKQPPLSSADIAKKGASLSHALAQAAQASSTTNDSKLLASLKNPASKAPSKIPAPRMTAATKAAAAASAAKYSSATKKL